MLLRRPFLISNTLVGRPLVAGELDFSGMTGRVGSGTFFPDRMDLRWRDVPLDASFLVCDGKIFNRAELLDRLQSRLSPSCPVASLIRASYDRWGADCLRYLSGEFSFAIWDESERMLFCATDHVGARPLYYWFRNGRFVFANDPEAVLSHPAVPRLPNLRKIAMRGVLGGSGHFSQETFHEGILALPAGAWIKVDRGGPKPGRFWELDILPGLVPKGEDEACETLQGILVDSVEDRIAGVGSVGALLSGGLDSSSLVALAARSRAKSGGAITALAGVVPGNRGQGAADEKHFIDQFLEWPGVRMSYVSPPPDEGPFSGLDQPEKFSRTFVVTSRHFLYDALQRAALSQNLELLLDGGGGEFGVTSHNRVYFLELAFGLKLPALWRELRGLERHTGVSPIRELAAHVLNYLFPRRHLNPPLLLRAEFVQKYGVEVAPYRPGPDHRKVQLYRTRDYLARRTSAVGAQRWVPHSYPLLDKRLLEFCLAAPGSLKVQGGYLRVLIRRAMNGLLPPAIQWRTTKAPFSPDYFTRYNYQIEIARSWLARIHPADPVCEVVDLAALRDRLVPFRAGDSESSAYIAVPVTMYLINFLRQFSRFRP